MSEPERINLNDIPLEGITYGMLRRAFSEWDRLYREDPEAFQNDLKRILEGQTIEDYGIDATLTLLEMIGRVATDEEQQKIQNWPSQGANPT